MLYIYTGGNQCHKVRILKQVMARVLHHWAKSIRLAFLICEIGKNACCNTQNK